MVNRVIRNCSSALKTNVAPVQSLRYTDEVDTDEELGPLPSTRDNANVTATTVTSQTLYTEGETSAQAGLQARVEAVTKKSGGRGPLVAVARKEPRNFKRVKVNREQVRKVETRLEVRSALPKENTDTGQEPWLFGRLDITRKRLTCLSGKHPLLGL